VSTPPRNRRSKPAAPSSTSRRPGSSQAARRALRRGPAYQDSRLVLGPINYALMGAGVVAAVVGFYLLAIGEMSISPTLLVLGYCVLIPAGLLIERVPERSGKASRSPDSGGE